MASNSNRSTTEQPSPSTLLHVGRSFCLGMTGSIIFFLPFFQMMNFERNRYLNFWSWGDSVSFALTVLGLGVALAIVILPRRAILSVRLLWTARLAFLSLATLAIFYCVAYSCKDIVKGWLGAEWAVKNRGLLFAAGAGSALAGAGIAIAFLRRRFQAETLYRFAVSLLIPLPWVCIATAMMWSTYDVRSDSPGFAPVVSRAPETEGGPVLLLLFDGWSFTKITDEKGVREEYPNVRAFADRAVLCSSVVSPWHLTDPSMPRLFYQESGFLRQRGGRLFWDDGETVVPSEEAPNLFQAAHDCGYQTALIGVYHQYERMLGKDVDCYGGVYSYYTQTEPFAAEPLHWFAEGVYGWFQLSPVTSWTKAVRSWLDRHEWPVAYKRYSYDVTQKSLDDLLRVTEQCPQNTFLFFHFLAPHFPLVCAPDGSFDDEATYDDQLAYVDLVLGRIVDHLRSQKKYQDATILLLADHNMDRSSNAGPREWAGRRIPLLIKLPRQEEGAVFEGLIETQKIQPLLESAMRKRLSQEEAIEILTDISAESAMPEGVALVP